MKKFESRRYQERCIEQFKIWINDESSSEELATILLPTGLGKSFVTAKCIEQFKGKVLWVAHREELIDQGYDTLKTVIQDHRNISIEIGDRKGDPNADIVVGSVQTIARNRKHFESFCPDLIFIDEYHHYSEDNTHYHGLLERWPNAKILGATATPFRFSGQHLPLGRILIQMDIGTAVEKRYLVTPVPEPLLTSVSLADVKTKMGDFAIKDLSQAVNVDSRNKLISKRIIELVRDGKRQGILFAVDIPHSKAMYDLLKNEVRAAQVYGETPIEERRSIMSRVRNGEIDVITNLGVLIEGFDVPHFSFVGMARPTRSLGLYNQCIGRGLRLSPQKTDCIIVDVCDKIKVKQSRVTFSDMASHGDLYGDKKRAANVIKANVPIDPISSYLKNFPVFLNKNQDDRWRSDEDSFSISSWQLTDDQWVVTWTADKKESKIVTRSVFRPWNNFRIDNQNLVGRPVKHAKFGDGRVKQILSEENKKVLVEFGWGETCTLITDFLQIQTFVNEYSPTELEIKKIEKLFYICMPEAEDKGRVIQFNRIAGSELKLISDQRMRRNDADIFLQEEAQRDGVIQLVRCGAKWKNATASDKQKQFVEKMLYDKRISFSIDIDNLTKGEASSVIEQMKWENVIRKKFGTNSKEKLLGYDNTTEDV